MSESYTIQALLSKGFCRLEGMKWFAFSEFKWKLLGTYIKSSIILKIFFISPQVMLSTFAYDTSLWPKYLCLCYCCALLCFRGRPLVLLHGDGRCSTCGARERYFLSWGWLKILITYISLEFSKQYLAYPCILCRGVFLFLQTDRRVAGHVKILTL